MTCRNRSLRGPPHALACSSLLDVERSLPDLTCDLIGQVEREYFVRFACRNTRETSPDAPATAACRGGA